MSNITKNIINGKLNSTIIYNIPITITDIVNGVNISWDEFTFYSPNGNFTVESINQNILRDDSLNKTVLLTVDDVNGVRLYTIFEGAFTNLDFGLEGDFVIWLSIPTNDIEEITGFYKEVVDGS